jgi:hypothetical protein
MTTVTFDELLSQLVARAVQARIDEVQRPTHCHQRNCEQIVGVPRGAFLTAARAGWFPSYKQQRLTLARVEDVIAWIESRPRERPRRPAGGFATEAEALAYVGARRVDDSEFLPQDDLDRALGIRIKRKPR